MKRLLLHLFPLLRQNSAEDIISQSNLGQDLSSLKRKKFIGKYLINLILSKQLAQL